MKDDNNNTTTTVEYFHKEVMEFRKLFGNLDFWAKPPEKRKIAINGLAFVYLNIDCPTPEDVQRCADLLDATLAEYSMREFKMIMLGKTKGVA